jgi:hypothetical protein
VGDDQIGSVGGSPRYCGGDRSIHEGSIHILVHVNIIKSLVNIYFYFFILQSTGSYYLGVMVGSTMETTAGMFAIIVMFIFVVSTSRAIR